jgi:uncharacterized protein YbjT (DUF2867 family)
MYLENYQKAQTYIHFLHKNPLDSSPSQMGTMSTIKNVAIASAAGALGSAVLQKLVDCNLFNVRILRAKSSKSVFPVGMDVVDVDYSSIDWLKSALAGQDAVVFTVGTPGLAGQTTLVDAAIAAGVGRFLPSEYGVDLDNPKTR